MTGKRILIAHPYMAPPGGGDGLAAHALQALISDGFDVSLACNTPPDFEGLNRFFGTSLKSNDIEIFQVPERLERMMNIIPTPQAFLKYCVLQRYVKWLTRSQNFDKFISTSNEFCFPIPGLQYIHWPRTRYDRPDNDYRWYHRIPFLLWTYRGFCRWVAGENDRAIRRNMTICNSSFTASAFREIHGTAPVVLFPPAIGDFKSVPWNKRKNQFVCLGRIHPDKRIDQSIEILRAVRERGYRIELRLIGYWNSTGYYSDHLKELIDENKNWIDWLPDWPRDRINNELSHTRYGIHSMHGEHFGMAVAEMQRAGCVTFVHNSGGPTEIIGNRSEQRFQSIDDAVEQVCTVLSNEELQKKLHSNAINRSDLFTTERFTHEFLEIVRAY